MTSSFRLPATGILLTIAGTLSAQPSAYWRAGLHLATESEVYVVGPQLQAGIGRIWPTGWGWLAEGMVFSGRRSEAISGLGRQTVRFRQGTISAAVSKSFGRRPGDGFYALLGAGWQSRREALSDMFGTDLFRPSYLTALAELGHRWRLQGRRLTGMSASVRLSGPRFYREGDVRVTEILTQLSAGMVFDGSFGRGR